MRDFRLHEMSDDAFEELVGYICSQELGTGTVTFSKGPDGGRDGRFTGTANNYPSKQSPWSGKFIIQAKHTSNAIASCSDKGFYSNKSSVVLTEIKRVKKLRDNGEVDNYLIFTNRKLSGGADQKIISCIQRETAVDNVALIGIETLQRMIANHYKEVRRLFHHFDQMRGPLIFYSQDLKALLTAISKHGIIKKAMGYTFEFDFVSILKKNELNRLSEIYFKLIQSDSMPYFGQIERFLTSPLNTDLADLYDNIVVDFNNKILIRRDDYDKFEEIFEVIYDSILEQEPELQTKHRLLYSMLHYMYWKCDLGQKC
jgi:hypothetical protein